MPKLGGNDDGNNNSNQPSLKKLPPEIVRPVLHHFVENFIGHYNISESNENARAPFLEAIDNNDESIIFMVKLHIKESYDPRDSLHMSFIQHIYNHVDKDGRNIWHCLAASGSTAIRQMIVQMTRDLLKSCETASPAAVVSTATTEGGAPSINRTHHYIDMRRTILAKINELDRDFGRAPLHVACHHGDTELIKTYIEEFKANVSDTTFLCRYFKRKSCTNSRLTDQFIWSRH